VQRVDDLIGADRRITIDSVATAQGCSHGFAYIILLDRLSSGKWVPIELKDRAK
jgi:hypothetical protein